MSLARLILALRVDTWTPELLATFSAQFGAPNEYTFIQRAKLIGQYGPIARLLDIVQQATLAPFAKKDKPPKSVLPSDKPQHHMSDDERDHLIEVLGINRQGEGLKDGDWADYSDRLD